MNIEYKSLDFLGYPNYKVDNLGNIYRFRFWRSGLNEEQCNIIKNEYQKYYTYEQLSKKYNLAINTIRNIVNLNKENYWIKMKSSKNKGGYLSISLFKQFTISKRYSIHRLMYEAWYGPIPNNMEVCHNDGNPSNNNKNNLRADTRKGNCQDKKKHGTYHYGEIVNGAILKEIDVIMIRYLYKFLLQKEIASLYMVHIMTVSDIIRRKTWSHI